MRLPPIALLALLAFLPLLSGCAENKVAGATSETTNGDLQASLTYSDGKPAARVRVLLVDEEGWLDKVPAGKSAVLDSAVTDSAGRFAMKVPLGKRCNLQAEAPGESGEAVIIKGADTLADTGTGKPARSFRLAPTGGFSGTVKADSALVEKLFLYGTAYAANVGGDGQYRFPDVAADTHRVVAQVYRDGTQQAALARPVIVKPGVLAENEVLVVAADEVRIEDFQMGFQRTALGRMFGGGEWFVRTDSVEGGNSSLELLFTPEMQPPAFPQPIPNYCLQVDYSLGRALAHPWANVGFWIGERDSAYDLSGVRSISFWARGKGSIMVRFTSRAVQRLYKDSAHFQTQVDLPEAWARITLPLDEMRVPDWADPALKAWPWSRAAQEILTVDFKASPPAADTGDTVQLFLDGITFDGMPLDRFAR